MKTKGETIKEMGYGKNEAADYQQMAKNPDIVRKADGRHATTAQEGIGAVFKMLTWKSKDRRKKRDSGAGQRRKRLILSLRGLQEMKRFILYRQKEEDPAGRTDKAHCRKYRREPLITR